jgi:hypothetical protein
MPADTKRLLVNILLLLRLYDAVQRRAWGTFEILSGELSLDTLRRSATNLQAVGVRERVV